MNLFKLEKGKQMIDDRFLINRLKLKGTTPEGTFVSLWFWLSRAEHETFIFSFLVGKV